MVLHSHEAFLLALFVVANVDCARPADNLAMVQFAQSLVQLGAGRWSYFVVITSL